MLSGWTHTHANVLTKVISRNQAHTSLWSGLKIKVKIFKPGARQQATSTCFLGINFVHVSTCALVCVCVSALEGINNQCSSVTCCDIGHV